MPLTLRWTDDLEIIARTRLRCYGKSASDFDNYLGRAKDDPRCGPGDYLLAELDGVPVGTATHLSLAMHARGGTIATQGVAWVGADRIARRKPGAGIATAIMQAMIHHARDRGDAATALMPFRGSYYEHFGYGVVERRHEWTVPLSVLPRGDAGALRYYTPADFIARSTLARDVVTTGQCDFDWSDDYWRATDQSPEGFEMIGSVGDAGRVDVSFRLAHQHTDGRDIARIPSLFYRDAGALQRVLCFLSTLKDQYTAAVVTLPADVPLNRMLTEVQLPHRPVNHAVASCRPYTRMQVRVLDHAKFLQALRWPVGCAGSATVVVDETEGGASRFKVDVHAGRATVMPATTGEDLRCPDHVWAAIACGDLAVSTAARFKLAVITPTAKFLDALAEGPAPFSNLYF